MVRYDMDISAYDTVGEVGRLAESGRRARERAEAAGADASRCFGTATTAASAFIAFLLRVSPEGAAVLAEVETRRTAVEAALDAVVVGDGAMAATAEQAADAAARRVGPVLGGGPA
ncbi:hypothetical protein [Nesterenkonia sp. F]|uniref:hypothetical protein n=1 Tax=Nesterenkonia sp. F TaxID=795955 RepID=UPI0002D3B4ED|nr:hypothetical protein [Nesterenkonia sp. F]